MDFTGKRVSFLEAKVDPAVAVNVHPTYPMTSSVVGYESSQLPPQLTTCIDLNIDGCSLTHDSTLLGTIVGCEMS